MMSPSPPFLGLAAATSDQPAHGPPLTAAYDLARSVLQWQICVIQKTMSHDLVLGAVEFSTAAHCLIRSSVLQEHIAGNTITYNRLAAPPCPHPGAAAMSHVRSL